MSGSSAVVGSWGNDIRSGARPEDTSFPDSVDVRIPRAFEHFIRWTIEREWSGLGPKLIEEDRAAFAGYYRTLPATADRTGTARYLRGLWSTESGWVWRWLMARSGAGCGTGGAPRVLDAGSGFGSFSMLFASLGAEVTGVDLRDDRVRVAETRLAEHRRRAARPLAVSFERRNLVEDTGGPYDLVWVYNAISHIDPPGRFLERVRQSLAPGGVVVIADINGGLAAHQRRLRSVRSEVRQTYRSPEGETHSYAMERTFSPAALRTLAEQSGLRVAHHELFYFGLGRLPEPVVKFVVRPMQRWWRLGTPVARRQLLVATADSITH